MLGGRAKPRHWSALGLERRPGQADLQSLTASDLRERRREAGMPLLRHGWPDSVSPRLHPSSGRSDGRASTLVNMTFDEYFDWLVPWEGAAYENVPGDPGGPTKYGIDQRSHPDVNIRALTKEQAKAIY